MWSDKEGDWDWKGRIGAAKCPNWMSLICRLAVWHSIEYQEQFNQF